MSTKASIAYGDGFHFYQECLDEDNVYLELEKVSFVATENSVMVQIPMHVWKTIAAKGKKIK